MAGTDDMKKQLLEMQLDSLVGEGRSLEAAVASLRSGLSRVFQQLLDEVISDRASKLDAWDKLIVDNVEGSTARGENHTNWYLPPGDGGRRWSRLSSQMAGSGLADALDSIDASTDAIVNELAQPHTSDRRRGLVVGNVQSGKTANYAAVAAKALDAGYRFVIVLSGIHNNLRRQTQERINRDLGVDANPSEWFQLTTPSHDFAPSEKKNAAANVRNLDKTKMIAVMKKNASRLNYLLDFLDQIDEKTLKGTPILIIDDESDQATPDSSPGDDNDPTTINRLLKSVWTRVSNGSYVGYTATPFANVFMNPDEGPDGSLEELYPSDFIHVMPTPDNYFGAEKLFGISEGSIDADQSEGLDVIRRIPKAELPMLAPTGGADVDSFSPGITQSLSDAIRWFIVASAIRRLRGQHRKHSSMLVHTTHRTKPHSAMRETINGFLEPLKMSGRNGEVESFRKIFEAEEARVAELYTGTGPAPTWPAVSRELPNVLRALKVVVDNGDEDISERLHYTDDAPQTVIVIGGGTLSRGLTLEGLFVSFFTRTSNTYDTLLQMGRWFGYRPGYEDLQRIWLTEGLDTDYQFLAQVEAELRSEIRRMTADGLRPQDIGVRVLRHPGRLQVTSKAKMKHTQEVEVSFNGYRTQTTLFDFKDPRVQDRNLESATRLLREIQSHEVKSRTGARLFTGVSFPQIKKFFEYYSPHDEFAETQGKAIEWVGENVPDIPWRVALANGAREKVFTDMGFTVQSVNRAPLRDAIDKSVNIRALMSGNDRILDLLAEDSPKAALAKSDDERVTLRRLPKNEGGAGGEGLLVLYPISRDSRASEISGSNNIRADMKDVLKEIRLSDTEEEDSNPQRPIMGYGLVLPSLPGGDPGTYVAVTPNSGIADRNDLDSIEEA